MSGFYQFCTSSESLLKQCIDAAPPPDPRNKWVLQFGQKVKKHKNSDTFDSENINIVNEEEAKEEISLWEVQEEPKLAENDSKIDIEFFEQLEADPIANFDAMIVECNKNTRLLLEIIEKLPPSTVEKICNFFFTRTDIPEQFIIKFYEIFLPSFLRKDYTWFSLDLLVKSHKKYPDKFKKLLVLLIKDTKISHKLLEEFYGNLNKEKDNFIKTVMEMDLSAEQFLHNLLLIFLVYKDAKKTEHIQNFLHSHIILYGSQCANEKNFGRLLLAYLQAQNSIGLIKSHEILKRIIETHNTPFKKPCMSALVENFEKFNV